MSRRMLMAVDRRWLSALVVTFLGVLVSLFLWARSSSAPILLERLNSELRAELYTSVAGSASSLLGFVMATLALLLALPGGRSMNTTQAHGILVRLLLGTALFLLVALVSATLGLALDRQDNGIIPLQVTMLSALATSLLGLLVGGIAFALVLAVASEPGS